MSASYDREQHQERTRQTEHYLQPRKRLLASLEFAVATSKKQRAGQYEPWRIREEVSEFVARPFSSKKDYDMWFRNVVAKPSAKVLDIGRGSGIPTAMLIFIRDAETSEEDLAPMQELVQDNKRLKTENAHYKSLLREQSQEFAAVASNTRSMEERINSILNGESYEKLDDLLDFDRDQVLDILCSKTAEGEINLETETGMQTWQSVVNYFESNCDSGEVQSIFYKLAECSRKELRTRANEFIYDVLFALNGGVNADIDAGYWAADKYAKFILKRRVKKLQKEFRG